MRHAMPSPSGDDAAGIRYPHWGYTVSPCTYLKELHPHTSDDALVRFWEGPHKYALRARPAGTWVTDHVLSVTGFLDTLAPEFPEIIAINTCKSVKVRFLFWYENRLRYPDPRTPVARFKGEPIWPPKYYCFIPLVVFIKILRGMDLAAKETWGDMTWRPVLPPPLGNLSPKDISDAWSRAGTELHGQIERYLNRMPSPTPRTAEWDQVLWFLRDHAAQYEWIRTEMRIAIPGLRICGSFDALARTRDGRYILVDWKNSKKIKASPEEDTDARESKRFFPPLQMLHATARNKYTLQATMYKIALEKHCGIRIAEMYLVIFHESNPTYIKAPVSDLASEYPEVKAALYSILRKRRRFVAEVLQQEEAAMRAGEPDEDEMQAALEADAEREARGRMLRRVYPH